MMVTLTQLRLDPRDPRSLRLLGEPYELHRFVWAAVSGGADPGRVLYRIEDTTSPRLREPSVLIQTERLVEPTVVGNDPPYATIDVKTVNVTLRVAGRYRFRTRVNPVRSIPPSGPGSRGKRVGVYDAGEQQEWFVRQLERSGFVLRVLDHRREPWLQVSKRSESGRRTLTFASALFEGVLEVRTPDLAEQAVVAGIGPGKGFGFGLLSLAPL